jgi:hypothetical protein
MLDEIIGKWGYSTDEENWNGDGWFETKEEAIQEGKENYEGDFSFYVGKAVEVKPYVEVERFLDEISESIYDECGDCAEDYLNGLDVQIKHELGKELNQVLQNWLTKHNLHPNFYLIEDVEQIYLED